MYGAAPCARTRTGRHRLSPRAEFSGPDLVPRRHLPRLVRGGRNADPPDAGVPDDQLRHGSDDELHDGDPGRPDPDGGRPAHPALGPDQRALRDLLSVSSRAIPSLSHIYVIVMENHEYRVDRRQCQRAVHHSLISRYGLATNYHAVSHPSEPNYLALFSGSTQGVTDDESTPSPDATSPTSWRRRARRGGCLPRTCPSGATTTTSSGWPEHRHVARKHEPAISFTNIRTSAGALCQITNFAHFDPAAQTSSSSSRTCATTCTTARSRPATPSSRDSSEDPHVPIESSRRRPHPDLGRGLDEPRWRRQGRDPGHRSAGPRRLSLGDRAQPLLARAHRREAWGLGCRNQPAGERPARVSLGDHVLGDDEGSAFDGALSPRDRRGSDAQIGTSSCRLPRPDARSAPERASGRGTPATRLVPIRGPTPDGRAATRLVERRSLRRPRGRGRLAEELAQVVRRAGVVQAAQAPGVLDGAHERVVVVRDRRAIAGAGTRTDDQGRDLAAATEARRALVPGQDEDAGGMTRQDVRILGTNP